MTRGECTLSNYESTEVKNLHEPERRFIFHKNEFNTIKSFSTPQKILYASNMNLLSMIVLAHLRITKLRDNDHGNITGIKKASISPKIFLNLRK